MKNNKEDDNLHLFISQLYNCSEDHTYLMSYLFMFQFNI